VTTKKTCSIVPAPRQPAAGPTGAPQNAIEVAPPTEPLTPRRSLLQAILRRWWIVLLAVLGSAAAGGVYLAKATPLYASSSRLLVEQTGPKVIATSDGLTAPSKNYLYTQCELLKSTPILSGALELLGSATLKTFGERANPIARLKAELDASVGKADDIITVTLESPYRHEAASIVNAIVESYIAYQSRQQRNTAAEILKILQREKVRRDAELEERFEAAMAFRRDNEIISFGTDRSNVILQRLETLSNALTEADLALMEAKARHEATRALLSDPDKVRALSEGLLDGRAAVSPEAGTLQAERNRLNLELTALLHECTEDHPAVQVVKAKLRRLDEQEAQGLRALARAHLSRLKQEVAACQSRLDDLSEALAEQRKLAQELNSKSVQYAMLDAERQRAERICDILDSRIKEIDITEDAGALNIGLLEAARPAARPCKPQRAQTMGVATALGLLLGIGLALLREWMDHRLRSAEEVVEALGLPVLGVLPRMSARRAAARRGRVVHLEPTSRAAEAYRTVRTAVYFGAPDLETRTVAVTSPDQGDGKSTLVANLGAAMAQAGQAVIVLDADLRKPNQHKIFELEDGGVGVTDILAGSASMEEAIQPAGIDGLQVLPCGKIPPNPSEMLNSQAFARLLSELAQRYDRVLVDGPPVLGLADARILGATCDAALLVLHAEKSRRRPSQRAVESLLSVGTRILGVVVNGVAGRGRGYGYHEYGDYHYSYGDYGRQLESKPNAAAGGTAKHKAA
jgi:capsular exopolysaccharide synthesis family protein